MKKPALNSIVLKALEENYTFPSDRGELNLCQVTQLSLTNLEKVGAMLYEEAQKTGFTLLGGKTDRTPQKKLEIIQAIAQYKSEMVEWRAEKAQERAEAEQLKQLLISAKMEKEVEALKEMTPKQIKTRLKELEKKLK